MSATTAPGAPSDYQPFTWLFIADLPSRLLSDGVDEPSGYQAFRPERIAILPSRVCHDGGNWPSDYQGFRLERIAASLRVLGVHGCDDRARR